MTPVPSLNDQSCCSGTTGRTKGARHSGGRSIVSVAQGLLWSSNGGTVVATVIAQWALLVGQRRLNGGTRKAKASLKLIHNVHNSTHFLRGDQWPTTVHPFCDHGDVYASPLPPLSDLWATDLLGNLWATVLNMLKTSCRPWRPWRCLNVYHPWTTKATDRPPLCLQRRPDRFCGRTREVQRSQPLCKGGINDDITRNCPRNDLKSRGVNAVDITRSRQPFWMTSSGPKILNQSENQTETLKKTCLNFADINILEKQFHQHCFRLFWSSITTAVNLLSLQCGEYSAGTDKCLWCPECTVARATTLNPFYNMEWWNTKWLRK